MCFKYIELQLSYCCKRIIFLQIMFSLFILKLIEQREHREQDFLSEISLFDQSLFIIQL